MDGITLKIISVVILLVIGGFAFVGNCYGASSLGQYFFDKVMLSSYLEFPIDSESFADELFQQGEYDLAAHEYQRELVTAANPQEKQLKLAISFIRAGNLSRAKEDLNELVSSDYYELRIKSGRLLGFIDYRNGNNLAGRFEFSDLLSYSQEADFIAEWHYWLGWGYLLIYDFPSADSEFSVVVQPEFQSTHFYPSAYLILKSIRTQTDNLPYRSPTLAKWFSAVLPGSGQAYVGDYTDAIASCLLNLGFGYLTVSSLLNKRYFQSLVYYYFLWNRYYFGSGDNAYRLAMEFNKKGKEEFVKALMDAHLKW